MADKADDRAHQRRLSCPDPREARAAAAPEGGARAGALAHVQARAADARPVPAAGAPACAAPLCDYERSRQSGGPDRTAGRSAPAG